MRIIQGMNLMTQMATAIALLTALGCGGATARPETPSLTSSSSSCVDGYVRDVFNRGDLAAADRYFDSRMVDHAPWPGQPPTLAGFKAGLAELRRAFPDLEVTMHRTVTEGDLVAVHMTLRGTHRGAFMGAPPTGKRIEVEAMDIVRVAGGKVTEHWGVLDEAKMSRDLGGGP